MDIQFKKGALELSVLAILSRKECYGYEVYLEVSKKIEISESTIYPILRKLKKEGCFSTYLKESSEGAARKYYKITESGRQKYEEISEEWHNFVNGIGDILKGDINDEG